MTTYLTLKWLHIIAMAYWLGGEWGVFNTSRYVTDPKLSLDERHRHMETAHRIDILPRTGIILLLPLGLHMGSILGVHSLGGAWIVGMWIFVGLWYCLTLSAFFKRGTDTGLRLTKMDEAIRFVVIPILLISALWSLFYGAPFIAKWYAAKVLVYAILLIMGLALRFIMRDWIIQFRKLADSGTAVAADAKLAQSIKLGRGIAYFYWIGIALVAYFGVAKPF